MWLTQIVASARQLKPLFTKKRKQDDVEVWTRKPWREQARPDQLLPEGEWTTWLILAGRGWGKALAIDTPIATPAGWTTMGALAPGDMVFDEHCQPCRVTFATEVMLDHVCYDVVFDDGSAITADAEHLWLTETVGAAQAAVVTTEQIRSTLNADGQPNHSIAVPFRRTRRSVVDIRPTASVPVRCIQVDSPSHLFLAGRAMIPTHNTRTGAEAVIEEARRDPNARIALVGRTAADVRDVMITGESGVLACSPPDFRPIYNSSKRKLTWPNGAMATAYSAEKPDQLRGPQHTFAWADELAAWFMGAKRGRNAKPNGTPEAWEQLQFTLRLGERPRAIVTTTPRPVQVIRDLLAEQTTAKNPAGTTAVTRGSTFDNAKNLAKTFLHKIVAKFKGTRLGEQELNGAVLDDAPGALWKRDRIDRLRREKAPDLYRIVVAVDPAASTGEDSAETGIIVAGVGYDGHGYLLEDCSGRYQPEEWAAVAIDAYDRYKANYIVAEKNNGGNMVEATIRAACRSQMMAPEPGEDRKVRKAMVPYQAVSASQGKETRAEPIAVFCEQGLIHHVWTHPARPDVLVGGLPITKNPFTQLEDQQCLVGGTLVTTIGGDVPIEHVLSGEFVLTRRGWRRVTWAGSTGVAPTFAIRTASGSIVRGTATHPVWVDGHGFRPLVEVQAGQRILSCHTLRRTHSSSSTANATSATSATDTSSPVEPAVDDCCTGTCGQRQTDRYLPVGTCTTSTRTQATTCLRTSARCPRGIMLRSMSLEVAGMSHQPSRARGEKQSGQQGSLESCSVQCAECCSCPQVFELDIVVDAAAEPRTSETVYNLTVEGDPEYFANGVLVHNCTWDPNSGMASPDRIDAYVWAFSKLPIGVKRQRRDEVAPKPKTAEQEFAEARGF